MTKTNKKTNKVTLKPTRFSQTEFSFPSLISICCIAGLTVQFFFTMKIILIDKEIATLALSLLFVLIFVIGYFAFSRDVKITKRLLIIELCCVFGIGVLLTVIYLFQGLKLADTLFFGIGTFALCSIFPLTNYWLTIKNDFLPAASAPKATMKKRAQK
jgi:hypothetical protein